MSQRVVSGARELGVDLNPEAVDLLDRFVDEVYDWAGGHGLTAIRRADADRLHILDSLSVVPFIEQASRIADLGSGAGFPGIPLAIVLTEATLTLVDSSRKRTNFLRHVRRTLGLNNVEIVESDIAALDDGVEPFDGVVARAFRAPAEFLALAAAISRPGAAIVLMAGPLSDDELAQAATAAADRVVLREERRFQLPGGSDGRLVARFERLP